MWSIHTTEYSSAIRQGEILPFATTWMDPGNSKLSKISQRKSRSMTTLTWYIKLKATNEQTRQTTKIHRLDNSRVVTRRKRGVRRGSKG